LPSMRVIGMRKPTMPRNCDWMKVSGASVTAQGSAREPS
jgi:hypothetical protein